MFVQKLCPESLYQILPSPQSSHVLLLHFEFSTQLASSGLLQHNGVLTFSSCVFLGLSSCICHHQSC